MGGKDEFYLLKYIKSLLFDVKVEVEIPKELADNKDFLEIDKTIKTIREISNALSTGNISYEIKGRGYTIGSLKNLQSALKTLTYKTKAIALGDFTQNIDFLGEFSDAFNSMTKKLESSINELNEAKEHFELIFQTIPDATVISRIEMGSIIDYNEAFLELTGYTEEEMNNLTAMDFYEDLEKSKYYKEKLLKNGFIDNTEMIFNNKINGKRIGLISAKIINIKGEDCILSVIKDITKQKETEEKLRESEERHRLLADNASDVIWTMDLEGKFTYISPSVEKLRGYTVEEVMKQSPDEVLCKDSLIYMQEGLIKTMKDIENNRPFPDFRGELEQPCKDGTTVWTDTTVSGIYNEKGDFKGMLGVTRDISSQKKMQEEITKISITDKLTQIYNRVKLDEVLENELKRSMRSKSSFSVIMADIDKFKLVNDNYGHQVGDIVLSEVSKILKDNSRSIDVIGRWGGEEFIIILPNSNLSGAKILAEKLRVKIENAKFTKAGNITCSFGVAEYIEGDTSDDLVSRADAALYRAKDNGRNRVEI